MIGQKGMPAGSGGVERHVEDLSRQLARAGHEVIVYCQLPYRRTSKRIPRWYGIQLFYIPTIPTKHLATVVHTFFSTIHAMFLRPDIIHYHGIGPSLFSVIPRILTPWTKVIATFHSQDYYHQKWGRVARAVFHAGEYVACRWTHETIAVSKSLQEYILRAHHRNASYIPNAVSSHEKIKPNKIKAMGLTSGSYILSVSRLVRHKGIHRIIDAYKQLKMLMPRTPQLVIVGGSSYTDEYIRAIKESAAGDQDIIFTGELSGSILGELYSNAALFIQASEDEGISIALLEAMSFECPALVSNVPGNTEVIS